jgi:hypothetical protein
MQPASITVAIAMIRDGFISVTSQFFTRLAAVLAE